MLKLNGNIVEITSFRMEHREWHSMWKIWKSTKKMACCVLK